MFTYQVECYQSDLNSSRTIQSLREVINSVAADSNNLNVRLVKVLNARGELVALFDSRAAMNGSHIDKEALA